MNTERLQLLYLIAYDYYINELKQQEIAQKHDINRVQVSRYLSEAKEKGLIEINVINPLKNKNQYLKEEIMEKFPVKKVLIAITYNQSREDILEALAKKAQEYINSTFLPADQVGIGWGTTLFQLAKNFKADRLLNDIKFIPLVGGSHKFDKEFQANNISFMIAEKLGAKSFPLMAPFYANNLKEYETIIKNSDVKKILDKWNELTKIIVGIGSNFSKTPLMKLNVLNEKDLTKLLNFRQVGDILTHYFNLEGQFCELDIYNKLISCSPDNLSNVKEVIAVAGGLEKKESITGALKTGLIDTIILDNITADKIIKNT
ncbi:sugar-binding domain-containing protein [Halocella sp. SP3-1]|uniref:sugar-binding transcriptional regulator n=1 Tax=Halocella sp. SP3-1 TaxID=2382161 RepID=UPI000F755D53|nr:sugar-binding domain-containing protein [Halocella sp. SP3-1]AZO94280.1 hypothetical protein D7D81_06540 [Halocella sp. SP3-1]